MKTYLKIGQIISAINDIEAENYIYGPLGQNSNATVDEALARAGLPEPQNDGWGGNQ